MSLPSHGSNPHKLYESYSLSEPKTYIDFSVNLNPFGTLPSIKENWSDWLALIEDYPDPAGEALKEAIESYEGIKREHILLGNGGAQLITLLANHLAGKRVGIVQPTFVEYEQMCSAYGCEIESILLDEKTNWRNLDTVLSKINSLDALFLCHPNNPIGIIYSENQLAKLIERCEKENCYLIIDEAFYNFVDNFPTAAAYVSTSKHVIVIRSLTKMYSIAGLRLGYLLGPEHVIKALQARQPHWSLNALALEAGLHCLKAEEFAKKSRTYIKEEREKMIETLRQIGYVVSDSEVNYFLLRDTSLLKQEALIRYLLKNGVVPRHTENFQGLEGKWIRLAVKNHKENLLLLDLLKKWLQEQ